MASLKKLLFPLFILLGFFIPKTTAQNIQVITPNNAIESANEIKGMFGELINIPTDEIVNFYLDQWDDYPYSAQCIYPEASLIDMDTDYASFEWEHVGNQSYVVSYLRLSNGDISTQGISSNSIEFNIPNDLYIVTFQSRCSGGFKGALGIIIIEKAVMFTSTKDCFCRNFTKVWTESFSNVSGANVVANYSWPPGTTDGEYACLIKYDDGTTSSFHANIDFVPMYSIPSEVNLTQQCMSNMSFYSDNTLIYALGPNQGSAVRGNFTFALNGALTFTPQNGASGSIELSRCSAEKAVGKRSEYDEENLETLVLESLLNPFSAYTTIRYTLPQQEYIDILLFDAYGQQIKTIKDQALREAGVHQMQLDLSDLSNGMYFCVLKTQSQSIPLKLLKIE